MTGAAVEAGHRIQEAQAAVEAALPIRVSWPDPDRHGSEAIAAFAYADPAGWSIEGAIARGSKGLLISRIEVLPPPVAEAPHGITTRILQRIPVDKILAAVRAHAAYEQARKEGTRQILGQEPAPGVFTDQDAKSSAVVRRNAVTDELLQRVAHAYVRETAAGQPPGALKRLADQFDRPEKTIQRWIARARQEQWLGPGAPGRVGAEPGPKLYAWLSEQMSGDQAILADAASLAAGLGAESPEAVAGEALRSYRDPAEFEFPSRIGVAPLTLNVVAQILYGHSTGAEVAVRLGAGLGEDDAIQGIAAEVRQKIAEHA